MPYSVCNLGGTFPRPFILSMVDTFTSATCHPGQGLDAADLKGSLVTEPFSCAVQADKDICLNGGGTCEVTRDGFYTVNMMCVVFGAVTFLWYIRPKVLHLQSLPLRAWRLSGSK